MFRHAVLALSLLSIAGCGGGDDNPSDAVAQEPEVTVGVSTTVSADESADEDVTPPPDTTTTAPATTAPPVVEGADSAEDAVSEWFDGIEAKDLARMWSILDPELKIGASRSTWDACIAVQFDGLPADAVIDYDESEVYTEDGSVYSTGTGTVSAAGESYADPVTFEVVEREGGWFVIGTLTPNNPVGCIEQASS